jgi:hypothetical protein
LTYRTNSLSQRHGCPRRLHACAQCVLRSLHRRVALHLRWLPRHVLQIATKSRFCRSRLCSFPQSRATRCRHFRSLGQPLPRAAASCVKPTLRIEFRGWIISKLMAAATPHSACPRSFTEPRDFSFESIVTATRRYAGGYARMGAALQDSGRSIVYSCACCLRCSFSFPPACCDSQYVRHFRRPLLSCTSFRLVACIRRG